MRLIPIKEDLANQVLNYLYSCPYGQVFNLVNGLLEAGKTPITIPETAPTKEKQEKKAPLHSVSKKDIVPAKA